MVVIEGFATAWAIERLGRSSLPDPHPQPIGYLVIGGIASLTFVALADAVSGSV